LGYDLTTSDLGRSIYLRPILKFLQIFILQHCVLFLSQFRFLRVTIILSVSFPNSGHSSTSDNSFESCQFRDDPPPLGDRIHAMEPKILISELTLNIHIFGFRRIKFFENNAGRISNYRCSFTNWTKTVKT